MKVWLKGKLKLVKYKNYVKLDYVKNIKFSNMAYTLSILFPIVNTMSAYYGYGDNTIEVFNNTLTLQGDIFEKLSHFSAGLYAYPLMGFLIKEKKIKSEWMTILFSIFIVGFITMDYEIIEVFTAIKSGAIDALTITSDSFGVIYIQGDIFMGTLGAITAAFIYIIKHVFEKEKNSV